MVLVPEHLAGTSAKGRLPPQMYSRAGLRFLRAIEGKIRELREAGIDPDGKDGVAHIVMHPNTPPHGVPRLGAIRIHRRLQVPVGSVYVMDEATFKRGEDEGASKWKA